MRNRFIAIFIFSFITLSFSSAGNYVFPPYLSPGLRLGYEWGQGITLELKLSVGTAITHVSNKNVKTEFREFISLEDFQFFNVTIGIHALTVSDDVNKVGNYWYVEGQYGKLGLVKNLLPFTGISMGVWRSRLTESAKYLPKFGAFTGFIGWIEIDVRRLKDNTWRFDTGVSGSIPISSEYLIEKISNK